MTSKADLIAQIAAYFPAAVTDMLAAAVVSAIGFEAISGEGKPGATRIGGLPDLSVGTEWPVRSALDVERLTEAGGPNHAEHLTRHASQALPYNFIAQIDLSEAAALGGVAEDLPSEGRLLFFYDYMTGPWDDGAEAGRVIWDRGAVNDLTRRPQPAIFEDLAKQDEIEFQAAIAKYPALKDEEYSSTYWGPPQPKRLVVFWSLPNAFAFEVNSDKEFQSLLFPERDPETEDRESLYDTFLDFEPKGLPGGEKRLGWATDKLLGLPEPEQDDPRYDAAMVEKLGTRNVPTDQHRAFFDSNQHLAGDWRLLLQVSVTSYLQSPAEGTIYFLIRVDDLRQQKFDRVHAVYQQT